jgi:DNA-directed RNA polymerase subunit L
LNIQDKLSNSKSITLAENTFNIFPNPVKTNLNIQFNSEKNLEAVHLNITDVSGKNVFNKTLQNINNQLVSYNVNHLASGSYFINIRTEKGQLTKKVIIKN